MWNKFINLLSALFTVLNVGVALWFYLTTDEIAIPAHWEALESAWGYGRSWLILPLSALSVLIYLLLRYSRRHTLVNLPFAVTNKVAAHPLIVSMMSRATFLITLALFYVVLAVAQLVPLHNVLLFLLFFLLLSDVVWHVIRIYRVRK
ncbi:UNVERIFIED_CONTAM: hypothetical protein NY100_02765 [Prevotella sp. 15_C9]